MIFVQSPSVSFTEFLYSTWQNSANVCMPSPPDLEGKESKFLSSLLQLVPPVMV